MGNFRGTRCLGGEGNTYKQESTNKVSLDDLLHEFLEEAHNYYDGIFLRGYECAVQDIITAIKDNNIEL